MQLDELRGMHAGLQFGVTANDGISETMEAIQTGVAIATGSACAAEFLVRP